MFFESVITVLAVLGLSLLTAIRLKGLESIIINYRWVFVCLFLLPASTIYDVFFYLRGIVVFRLQSAPKKHESRVHGIQKQVRLWNAGGRQKPMCTARPGWLTMSFRTPLYKDSLNAIKIDLMDILEVDPDRRIVRVEPLVTMGQLTAFINPLGFTLPVVPELDELTVGGLIMGVGVETSSHVFGLFQETVLAIEMILQDGSVVRCSKDENRDLFMSAPWSHGTLGFLVAAELQIMLAAKYVKLEYFPTHSRSQLIQVFGSKSLEREKNNFVEAIVFSEEDSVVMTGTLTDHAEPTQINAIGHYWKPWFYLHVQKFLNSPTHSIEYIPLRHYYHRHTKSIFWMLSSIIPFGNHPVFRYLFGWMVPPKVSFLKLTQGETIRRLYEERQIIQDMLMPLKHLEASLQCFHQEVNLYPLWLCPFWLPAHPGFVHPHNNHDSSGEMYVDIGAYGEPKTPGYHFRTATRTLEAFVRKHHGFQMLYADSYMTEEEFREMFDHSLYDKIRQKLDCSRAFPSVYDKVNRAARY